MFAFSIEFSPRPDNAVHGPRFKIYDFRRYLAPFDMATVVQEEKDPKVPLFLIAVPGFDPSGKVVEVASSLQRKCDALAMGNSDCYEVRRGPPSYFRALRVLSRALSPSRSPHKFLRPFQP